MTREEMAKMAIKNLCFFEDCLILFVNTERYRLTGHPAGLLPDHACHLLLIQKLVLDGEYKEATKALSAYGRLLDSTGTRREDLP